MARKKQRGNGSGTVYPRKNKDGKVIGYRGSYIANGKRYYVSAKTKTEAEQKLRQSMTDAERGFTFDAGSLTLSGYLYRCSTTPCRTRSGIRPLSGTSRLCECTSNPLWEASG